MRTNTVGRATAAGATIRVVAPRQSVVTLPRREETVHEIIQSEMPLCTTPFETACCMLIVVLIGSCGVGIGLWYVVLS